MMMNNNKLSQSLNMKGFQSPDLLVPLAHQSHLSHIRGCSERMRKISMTDVKDIAEEHISIETLKEMETRALSRLSAYDEEDLSSAEKLSESLHSFSFQSSGNPPRNSLNLSPQHQMPMNQSLNASWQFYKFVGGSEENAEQVFNGGQRKPSEAIFTIDARTSKILVANQTACRLFGYKDEDLCGMKISKLFTMEDGIKHEIMIERNIECNGNIVMASGKILEAVDSEGQVFVVSVWMKRIKSGDGARCVVILEPVEVTKASLLFDGDGIIKDCDFTFAYLHGFGDPQDVVNKSIYQFVPSFLLPKVGQPIQKDMRKQWVTCHSKDMVPFSATIKVKEHDPEFHQLYMERDNTIKLQPSKFAYKAFMWVFANISGLLSVSSNGTIMSCNSNFMRIFLGSMEEELKGKSITMVIPYFYEQIELLCEDSLRIDSKQSSHKLKEKDALVTNIDTDNTLSDHDLQESSLDSISTIEDSEKQTNYLKEHVHQVQIPHCRTCEKEINTLGESSKDSLLDESVFVSKHCSDSNSSTNINNKPKDGGSLKVSTLEGFSPHASTPKLDEKPSFIDKKKLTQEKLKIDFENIEADIIEKNIGEVNIPELDLNQIDKYKNENNNLNDRKIKTSDYESLGSTINETNNVTDKLSNLQINNLNSSDDDVINTSVDDAIVNEGHSNSVNSENRNLEKDSSKPHNGSVQPSWTHSNDGSKQIRKIVPGQYYAQAKHKDGSLLPIIFEVKKVSSKSHEELFCIWLSRDPEDDGECLSGRREPCMNASYNTTLNASAGNFQEIIKSMKELEDPGRGPYNENFNTLNCVGKGAFGFVNLAENKATKEKVIVKFIRKEKVLKDGWIEDDDLGVVPFEIYLLAKLEHPNIVQMYEAYENEDFFQVVMEKHGDGIDLFEFIERKPLIDEALASYMFRQVLQAIDYLHSQKILHRDIKDENIIVDRQFRLKLIDFGSAAFLEEGKLFNTFCGTVEYCSPEVLLGNWYQGPELEMWSLGVTLYTFIFGEHPFFEVEETIRAELFPPFKISNELMFVICWMLHPEVEFRAKLVDIISYPWFTRHVNINDYNYDSVLGGDLDTPDGEFNQHDKENISNTKKHSYSISCSSVSSSTSSELSSSYHSALESSTDSERISREELKREYKKHLNDKNDTRSNILLSKSF